MTRRRVLAAWLTTVWMALWGDLQLQHLLGGAAVSLAVVALFPPDSSPWIVLRPIPAVRLAVHFTSNLVRASARLVAVVLDPRPGPPGSIIAVEIRPKAAGAVTLIANSISLTPGTLVIATAPTAAGTMLFVHVLDGRREPQERHEIEQLERLATAAFSTETSETQQDKEAR